MSQSCCFEIEVGTSMKDHAKKKKHRDELPHTCESISSFYHTEISLFALE